MPAKAQDLDQLIHWQVRKTAPFRVEDAQVSWVPGVAIDGGGREFVVSMARRDVIQSFERACDAAGVHAGLIDIASFSLINAQLAAAGTSGGDWLLVHVGADYVTLAVVRGGDLVFFRNRALGAEGDLADLVHQTAMYHEDRLGGGGFSRVVLAGASMAGAEQAERLRRGIEERIGGRVELLDVRTAAAMRDRISASPSCSTRSRRPSACCCANAPARSDPGVRSGGRGVMLRTNLSTRPFYNERAVHVVLGLAGARRARADGRQSRQVVRLSRQNTVLSATMREDRQSGRRAGAQGAADASGHQSGRAEGHRRGRARGQRAHRRAHVLVDGALQSDRVDAAARGHAGVGEADDQRKAGRRSRWSSSGAGPRISTSSWRSSRRRAHSRTCCRVSGT